MKTSQRLLAHLLGLIGFVGAGVLTGILYLVIVGTVLGLGDRSGFGLGAALFAFPIYSVPLAIIWMIFDEIQYRVRNAVLGWKATAIAGLLLGLVFAMLIAGPRGFTTAGGSILFNYFLILISLAGSLLHRKMLSVATPSAD